MLVCSCKKYLTLYPQNGTIRQEYWQNKEQLQSAVVGAYASLIQGVASSSNANSNRQIAESLFVWGELRADNVSAGTTSLVDEYNIINGNILPINDQVQWYAFYRTINQCNTILKFAPDVLSRDPTLTPAQLNAYLAEVLTIRSLMYFDLVRAFGDVPMQLEPTANDSDVHLLAKSKQADILAQIIKDLNTAEQNAVFTYGVSAYDKGRVTKYTINALQADIYLWTYDYNNCIIACDKIINSGQFGLVTGDSNFFNTVYANGNSNESIFEFQYDGSTTQVNPFYPMFSPSIKTALLAHPSVRGGLFPADPINSSNEDVRADIAANLGNQMISKWIGSPNSNATVSATTSFRHWIVYRYAEILLFKAEACSFVQRGQEALALVTQIQKRANNIYVQGISLDPPDPNDPTALSNYILDERDREFIFEGKRWFDLVRYAKRDFPNTAYILTNAIAKNASASVQQLLVAKYRDPNAFYLPIFNNELLLDPNLVQNPYYK